ncbi:hypothetical protein V5799_008391 [Amblyomma americanum]|uniref:Uncharacterized protein n=1 Tax=Amblyomma americanum TaxID=6943 RepID=A0AAQ4FDC0_AMBAM
MVEASQPASPRKRKTVCTVGSSKMADAVKIAAGFKPAEVKEDIVLVNHKQNSILIGTDSQERMQKYLQIGSIPTPKGRVDAFVYLVTPDGCGKGVIHRIPVSHTVESIQDMLKCSRNPEVMGVRRLGRHILGDRKCRELYRTPHIIKKRLWKERTQDNKSKATTDSENNASGRQSRPRTRAEGGFHMRQDSFSRLVSGTGSGGHGQSTGRSNSRGRSGSRDRLSCKGPSSSQGRSSSRGRSGSQGRSSSRGHSSSRKRSASRGRDNTGNKCNIGARPKIEGRSECHQQGSTPPTDKTNVPDDHKRVSFVDKVSHTHPPGGSEDILQLKRMVEKLTGAVTALQNENAELRKQLPLKI